MPLLNALSRATERISAPYFNLPIANHGWVQRERVYCYELYHQLRLALPAGDLMLMGEPDKRGHPDFIGSQPNPDFVLHVPGFHHGNTAAVEVECRVNVRHLTKDLRNLKVMRGMGYQTCVLLLVGRSRLSWRMLEQAALAAECDLNDYFVMLHRGPGQAATQELQP